MAFRLPRCHATPSRACFLPDAPEVEFPCAKDWRVHRAHCLEWIRNGPTGPRLRKSAWGAGCSPTRGSDVKLSIPYPSGSRCSPRQGPSPPLNGVGGRWPFANRESNQATVITRITARWAGAETVCRARRRSSTGRTSTRHRPWTRRRAGSTPPRGLARVPRGRGRSRRGSCRAPAPGTARTPPRRRGRRRGW